MRRAVAAAVAVLLVPAMSAAEPTEPTEPAAPVRVAAAPGETDPPGGPGAIDDPAPLTRPGLAPPGMSIAPLAEPAPPLPPAIPPRTGLVGRHDADAASHRAYGFATALTPPAGKWELSWRGPAAMAGIFDLSVALTDRIQLGIAAVYSDDDTDGAIGGGTLKIQVARTERAALAVHGMVFNQDDETFGVAGAVVSTCLDSECGAIVSAHVSAAFADPDDEDIPLLFGASLIAGRGTYKLLLEALIVEIEDDRGVLGVLGGRIGGRRFAFDIGVGIAAADGGGGAIPVAGLTIRP